MSTEPKNEWMILMPTDAHLERSLVKAYVETYLSYGSKLHYQVVNDSSTVNGFDPSTAIHDTVSFVIAYGDSWIKYGLDAWFPKPQVPKCVLILTPIPSFLSKEQSSGIGVHVPEVHSLRLIYSSGKRAIYQFFVQADEPMQLLKIIHRCIARDSLFFFRSSDDLLSDS